MVCLKDKEVFSVTVDEFKKMNAEYLLSHFLANDGEYKESAIFIYDNVGQYLGMVTYNSLCGNGDVVVKKYFVVSDKFWDEARRFFEENRNEEVPVFSDDMEPLCFCHYKADGYAARELSSLERLEVAELAVVQEIYFRFRLICIHDLNECNWRIYHLLKKCEYPVCVMEEQWNWFGIEKTEPDSSCLAQTKLHIYSLGRAWYRIKEETVERETGFVWEWRICIYRKILERQMALLKNRVTVCQFLLPNADEIDINKLPKSELINRLSPLSGENLSNNLIIRNRQREFLGEEYDILEKGQRAKMLAAGWVKVTYRDVKCEKLESIHFDKRLYLIGPCIVGSLFSMAQNSLVAQLQKYLMDYGYEVVRMMIPAVNPHLLKEISNLPIKENDIMVFIYEKYLMRLVDNSFWADLSELYNKERSEVWSADRCAAHVNSVANKAYAKEIFEDILQFGILQKESLKENRYVQKGEILSAELQQPILAYIDSLKQYSYQILGGQLFDNTNANTKIPKIGSIVMNCNPFTKGHQYLIEQAASQVDYLYIFVVQEDKSFFSFDDRFELVKAGTALFNNVIVVPSGEHVLSYKTLPVYFEKEEQKTAKVDATQDVEIFARYIAPRLGITCRFVGEEPIDMVTKQYNEQMADILPQFDIEFIEIPRKVTASDNEVISASKVRRLMKEEKWEDIRALVPDTTYDYLMSTYAYTDAIKM